MKKILSLIVLTLFAVTAQAQTIVIQDSTRMHCGGNWSQVKHAVINTSAGDNTLVAAVTGKKIRVLSYVLSADTADTTFTFESSVSGPNISGVITLADNGIVNANCGAAGCLETAAGALLNAVVATGTVDGHLTYIECD